MESLHKRDTEANVASGPLVRVWIEAIEGPLRQDRAAVIDWGRRRMAVMLRGTGVGDVDVNAARTVGVGGATRLARAATARVAARTGTRSAGDAVAHVTVLALAGARSRSVRADCVCVAVAIARRTFVNIRARRRMHEDGGINAYNVFMHAGHALPPVIFDIFFQFASPLAIIIDGLQTVIYFA